MILDYTLPQGRRFMPPTPEEFSTFSHDVMAKFDDLYNRINLLALDVAVLKSQISIRDKQNETKLKNWVIILGSAFVLIDGYLNHFVWK